MKGYNKLLAMLATTVMLSVGCTTVETESWQNCAIAGGLVGAATGAFISGEAIEVAAGGLVGAAAGDTLCGASDAIKIAAVIEPDTDGDGVVASRDQCPGTPAGVQVDKKGCLLELDADNDGVSDDKDQCPGSAPGKVVNALGCEDRWQLKGVNFHTKSATLTEEARVILKSQALAHQGESAEVHLVISGHTDSRDSISDNQLLSDNRANAVKEYMISQGSDAAKLTTIGYGETQPIADNASVEGRAKNRRVELTVQD